MSLSSLLNEVRNSFRQKRDEKLFIKHTHTHTHTYNLFMFSLSLEIHLYIFIQTHTRKLQKKREQKSKRKNKKTQYNFLALSFERSNWVSLSTNNDNRYVPFQRVTRKQG